MFTGLVVVVQSLSCVRLCDSMHCRTPGFPVLHCLPEFAQTHVHWVGDAIQPSHPLLPSSPPALYLSQHQGLFQWVGLFASGGQSIEASASDLPVNIQGWFPLVLIGLISLQSTGLSRVFSSTTIQSLNSSVPTLLYGPTFTSLHDYWRNHSYTILTFVNKVMSLHFNMLSRLVIASLQGARVF